MSIEVPIAPWLPDSPDFEKEGNTESLNVIPKDKSVGPFPSFGSISTALGTRCQGAIFVRLANGTGNIFAGDSTKLYRATSTTFSDVSRLAGGAYTCASDGFWSFSLFGSNLTAWNGNDAPQTFNVDSDSNFSALGGSPPTALYSCIAGDFVMTGNQTANRARVQWSAINNSASWATSQTTQASQQDLPDGGWIQGLVGIPYAAVVFQEFAIKLASYEGPPIIYRFSKIQDGLGCSIPGSIANYRDLIFFYDISGFYMLQGAATVTPIGEQRVNKWFQANVNQNYLARCNAAIDPVNGLYALGFPDTTSVSGEINHILIYAWTVDKWAHVQAGNLEYLFSAASQTSLTLDQLDTINTSVDALPFSLDSSVWTGVARRLIGGFGTDHKLGYFNGANLAATVTTTEGNLVPGKKGFVRSLRPIVDGGTWSVALGIRDRINDVVTYGIAVLQDAFGKCLFRSKARYHRAKMTSLAGDVWTHNQGVDDIEVKPMGMR